MKTVHLWTDHKGTKHWAIIAETWRDSVELTLAQIVFMLLFIIAAPFFFISDWWHQIRTRWNRPRAWTDDDVTAYLVKRLPPS